MHVGIASSPGSLHVGECEANVGQANLTVERDYVALTTNSVGRLRGLNLRVSHTRELL